MLWRTGINVGFPAKGNDPGKRGRPPPRSMSSRPGRVSDVLIHQGHQEHQGALRAQPIPHTDRRRSGAPRAPLVFLVSLVVNLRRLSHSVAPHISAISAGFNFLHRRRAAALHVIPDKPRSDRRASGRASEVLNHQGHQEHQGALRAQPIPHTDCRRSGAPRAPLVFLVSLVVNPAAPQPLGGSACLRDFNFLHRRCCRRFALLQLPLASVPAFAGMSGKLEPSMSGEYVV